MHCMILLYILLQGVLAARAGPQFHDSLSEGDLERYFGTRDKREVPEYEIVHPVHVSGSRLRRSLTSPKSPLQYHVTALGEEYHLHLNHNDELVTPGCLVTYTNRHGKEDISPCPTTDADCYYLGTSSRHNNSIVSVSTCRGLHGIISTPSHQLMIQPIRYQHVADVNIRSTAQAPHLVYKLSDRKARSCALTNAASQIASFSPRRVRRQTGKLNIEMLLVADKTMHGYHGNDLVNYMLTAANVAAGRYLDSSLGFPINLNIVRLKILQDDVPELNIIPDADKTLNSFCKWQEKFNPFSDNDPLHVDAASLMTRIDLVHKGIKDTTGLASLGGMCIRAMRCSVLEDNGLDIGITLAHETGHSLNMHHDGDGNFCDDKTNIMSTGGAGGSTAFKWSSCSRDSLQDFIYDGKTACLQDQPTAQTYSLSKDLPGVIYSGDRQCELFLGHGSRICEETSLVKPYGGDECGKLVCFDPNLPGQCTGSQAPRMDGTECGKRKWCISGVCTDIGKDGPAAQDGGWSEWDDHQTPCTRTCGGGVRVRTRKCNNPRPLFGGKKCEGHDSKAVLCNLERCSTSQVHFKEEQCAATDRFPLKGRLLHWLPGDTIGESVCMLFCHAEGEDTIHLRGVGTDTMYKDGTHCDSAKGSYNRCVKGQCRAFGCDGVSDSPARPDVCGVCNGNNDTCVKKKGSHFEGIEKQYVTFLTLPKGSTGIKMTNDNRYTWMSIRVNGKRMFNTNGRHRDRKDIYKQDGVKVLYAPFRPESIQIEGPIPVQIEAQVFRVYGDAYEDVTPEIFYEYYQPLGATSAAGAVVQPVDHRVDPTPPDYKWKTVEGQCGVTCGQGSAPVIAVCERSTNGQRVETNLCDGQQKPNTQSRICVRQSCPGRWEVGPFSSCSRSCDGGTMSRRVQCVQFVSGQDRVVSDNECPFDTRPAQSEICGTQECPGAWRSAPWSECSQTCGDGTRNREVTCYSPSNTRKDDTSCELSQKPSVRESCLDTACVVENTNTGTNGTGSADQVTSERGSDVRGSTGNRESDSTVNVSHKRGSDVNTAEQNDATSHDTSSVASTGSECVNVLDNCGLYTQDDCRKFPEWGRKNCRKYCNYCDNSGLQLTSTEATPSDCQDVNIHCAEYKDSVCQEYESWARTNCRRRCHFCGQVEQTTLAASTTPSPICNDVSSQCKEYPASVCVQYKPWAEINCRRFCKFCS